MTSSGQNDSLAEAIARARASLIDGIARAIFDSDEPREGEQWEDFEDDSIELEEYRKNARAVVAHLEVTGRL